MPKRTKDEAAITRQELLDAALAVFSRKGYSATRLEDIAAEAGVTRGAIYHHFGGKLELYNHLITEITGEVDPLILRAIEEGENALDTLRRIFIIPLEYAATNTRYRQASELMFFKTEAVPEMAEGMDQKMQGNDFFTRVVMDVVKKGQAAGEIREDVEARDAAVLLISAQGGALALWMMDEKIIELKQRAGFLADIFLRGLAILD